MGRVKLSVLGATGSIGRSTLDLVEHFPDRLEIVALAAGHRMDLLAEAVIRHGPVLVSVFGEDERRELSRLLAGHPIPEILIGPEGLELVAAGSGADTVLSAIVGAAGLKPTWAAVQRGLRVALANKESLVLGGELIVPRAGDRLVPVDSEHSAIFQALGGKLRAPSIRKIILTASGGPFRGWSLESLSEVTKDMALRHPKWSMGPKITCDSATLMNKGLEVIEAHHLFQVPYEKIEVLVHPQSVVHSLVEFEDGSQMAQLGPADMRLAIAYALSFPERWPLLGHDGSGNGEKPGLSGFKAHELSGNLSFEKPDRKVFRSLALAEEAGRVGGTAPAILNGANEAAVAAFLAGRLRFMAISQVVEECLNTLAAKPLRDMEQALEADGQSRNLADNLVENGRFF